MTGFKSIPDDTFTAAALGDADAQEAMCRLVLGEDADPFAASDLALWTAYLWANMALVNRRLAVRPIRIDILTALAARSMAGARGRAREFLIDALATVYEFDAENHPQASASLALLMATIEKDFDEAERAGIIEAARRLATQRVVALVDGTADLLPDPVRLH